MITRGRYTRPEVKDQAEVGGATLLHYDPAYDRIAEVTSQPMEWVAPKGSL